MNYGNLAYEYPEHYTQPVRRKKVQRVREDKRKREQMLCKVRNIRRIAAIVVVALSAGFMISEFVTVNETGQEIASLKKELNTIESATSQMIFDMEQSVDLAEIERQATTRLGMKRPEKYQTIYVNVKQDDYVESTAEEVEGLGNGMVSMLKRIGSNIVQFFSIK
ncbi:MAG: DUF2959 domain-containing protein [Clostridia bacterium]|nr:DUF2959 domain-containing protein [Clostridia bacterium]MCI8979238.1 DUF2959 domain-containing protein [Clostridia bacterium]MCI9085155.1 DUF2959 domain-containing protein [Clostridia bacterium]NDO18764.1 DUF2959 domain-containing protein [Lachnospiraceae bacterium MD329]